MNFWVPNPIIRLQSGCQCEVRGHSVGHYFISERVVVFVRFCYTTRKGVGDVSERPGSVRRVGAVVVVTAVTVGVIVEMRVRTIASPASAAATSSLAVSMWSSVAILAVTEFLDFSSEGGPTVGAKCSVLGCWKEGLFASRSLAKASKRADSGDKVWERRGVDLQGHSDSQVSKVSEKKREISMRRKVRAYLYLSNDRIIYR
ncbi:hypothetical protein PIB30_003961 [Stylosanthes scabra]|uniref:Uncharacterized protein n=1 Tax=Stylosanthes scabra TaxID=79078 RepID=A0ABU6W1M1_9FABA|nr:hypothetical protein [Stylosanthes scabra]